MKNDSASKLTWSKQQAIEIIRLIDSLQKLTDVDKIITTFIPAFKNKIVHHEDETTTLHGSFNLGGTRSGRQSANNPNLQQIPSTGTPYAKPIKRCFKAPPGWIFCGADFLSLEDRISALTTKDPNKLKVYIEGYDGHCLRARAYFGDQMPDIENTVESINSIEDKYPALRQHSKGPTFALTYQGTWRTLVTNFGFDEQTAKKIENNYHELYAVSDQWVQDKLQEATKKGYVELAFGLRLRTPILQQVILNSGRALPYEAHKEAKTAGNALGQSYGLLNTRAGNEFMQRVWSSQFRFDILPVAQIHDALYFLIRNRYRVLEWTNKNLIECMRWTGLPEIQHPEVKLEAELACYWPDWSAETTIPNDLTATEIEAYLASL
jgi:DNA polymerase-1